MERQALYRYRSGLKTGGSSQIKLWDELMRGLGWLMAISYIGSMSNLSELLNGDRVLGESRCFDKTSSKFVWALCCLNPCTTSGVRVKAIGEILQSSLTSHVDRVAAVARYSSYPPFLFPWKLVGYVGRGRIRSFHRCCVGCFPNFRAKDG